MTGVAVALDPLSLRFAFLAPPAGAGSAAGRRRRTVRRTWTERAVERRSEQCRQQVLRVIEQIAATAPSARVPGLLSRVGDLLTADVCCFHQVDLATAQRTALLWPDAGAGVHLEPHAGTPGQPTRYRELFAPLRTPHQLAIPLRLTGTVAVGCAAGRHDLGFTDYEQQLAGALQLALTPLGLQLPSTAELPVPPTGGLLTGRERDILLQLATGLTAAAIARALDISPRTVHKHLQHLYAKLGVSDRLSAVTQAQSMGLLPLPPRRTDRGAGPTGTARQAAPEPLPEPVAVAVPDASPLPPPRVVPAGSGGRPVGGRGFGRVIPGSSATCG